jgi:hypothetical protein
MRLQAEVIGRFDHAGDANALLYTPLEAALTARHTRCYTVEYTGDETALTAYLRKVLADPVSHELRTGGTPAWTTSAFFLDYGMKAGALDHEKETILAHYRSTLAAGDPGFAITSLKVNHRIYLFGEETGVEAHAGRFVRDVVNPAIHTWQISMV